MCGRCAFFLGAASGKLENLKLDIAGRLVDGYDILIEINMVIELIDKAYKAEEASYGEDSTV